MAKKPTQVKHSPVADKTATCAVCDKRQAEGWLLLACDTCGSDCCELHIRAVFQSKARGMWWTCYSCSPAEFEGNRAKPRTRKKTKESFGDALKVDPPKPKPKKDQS